MATELGSAFISVGLGTNTLSGDIKKAFGGAESSGRSAGAGAGKGFLTGFKGLVGAGMAVATAGVFGGFIAEAARASDATDKFKATMDFAGLNTKAIDAATTAAKAYADQTVYDLPTIQNTLAQLASNGVKDYTGLTKAAGNLNAVAGGNADTFKSVAMVMTQTAGAGKLTTENWNQLADAIPGAAGPLMKSLKEAGAYTGNFRDAMTDGQISSDEFNASLMKLGTDPVAVEAAKSTATFEGAIGNLEATINSGLMSALDAIKPAVTGVISGLASGISKVNGIIGGLFTGMKSLIMDGDITPTLLKSLGVEEDSPIIGGLLSLQDKFWAVYRGIQDFVTGFKIPTIFGPENMGLNEFAAAGAKVHGILVDIRGGFQAAFEAFKAGDGDVTSSGFAGFMERVGNAAREVTGGVRAMFAAFKAGDGDITSSGFAGFMEQVGGGARQLFDGLNRVIAPLIPQVVSLASAFSPMQIIFAAIRPLLPQLGSMFMQLASILGGTLLAVLTALTPMFVQLSGVVSDSLGIVLSAVLPALVQMITMLGATLSTLIPIIIPIIMTIVQLATTLISQLMPIITSLVASILPPLVDIFGNILSVIGPVVTMIAGLLIPIIMALMPVVVTVFGVIANVIKSAMQIIQGIIQVVTGIITGNWSQVWNGLGNIVSGALATVGNVLGGLFSIVTSALGGIGGWLVDSGKALIQGFIDGIGGMVGAIGDAVGGVLGAVADFFPHSPAKKGPFSGRGYTTYSGAALAGDFATSIEGQRSRVAAAAASVTGAAVLSGSMVPAGATSGASAASGASGSAGVNVNIHPAPGMSEETIGRVAAHSLNYQLRMA